jgi:hypothetical protein
VVRFGQLVQPRMQLLVASVGIDEALRVGAHLARQSLAVGPQLAAGRDAASWSWPGEVWPPPPGRPPNAHVSASACSRWRASRSSNASVHNSDNRCGRRRQPRFQPLLRLQPRFRHRPHA